MALKKQLFAIHTDAYGNAYRTKIAEGNTGDFGTPIGFQITRQEQYDDGKSTGVGAAELDGTYPAMLSGETSNLEGKLLTLADATFTNKDQREAYKSMVKEILWSHFSKNIDATEGTYRFTAMNPNSEFSSNAKDN